MENKTTIELTSIQKRLKRIADAAGIDFKKLLDADAKTKREKSGLVKQYRKEVKSIPAGYTGYAFYADGKIYTIPSKVTHNNEEYVFHTALQKKQVKKS